MNFHNITKDDMRNGDGLRVVLWVSGCEHHCKSCQNPITWDPNDGVVFDQAAKEELFTALDKPYISGITLSGGDPLHTQNRSAITALLQELHEKFPSKTVWLYTGYEWDQIKDLPLIPLVDVLADGKFVEECKDTTIHWVGSRNQKVIDVQQTLQQGKIVLWNS